jgi:hypothetical protein
VSHEQVQGEVPAPRVADRPGALDFEQVEDPSASAVCDSIVYGGGASEGGVPRWV